MGYPYTCDYCGKSFSRRQRAETKRVYCSTICYHAATRTGTEVQCPTCGKRHHLSPSQISEDRRFCSRQCYDVSRRNVVEKVCPVCSKTFEVLASIADRYTVCSNACRTASTKYVACKRCGKVFRAESRLNRHYCSEECRRPPKVTECRNCGKEFRHVPSDEDRQFCSFSCYRTFHGETIPEKSVRQVLESLQIHFMQEAQMGRYSIDFLLPELRIALEVDGIYWHRNTKRDERKTRYIESHGWRVCRITDSEIENAVNLSGFIAEKLQGMTLVEILCLQPSLL